MDGSDHRRRERVHPRTTRPRGSRGDGVIPHARSEVRVGTSGWVYANWRGVFYPKDLRRGHELEYLSRRLNTVEINGSFYSLQRPQRYLRWKAATPDDFRFAVESADIVLPRDQVGAVLDARDISDRAYRHTRGNIALAFLFNGIGVPLATTGLVYPVWAMVAMAASVTTIFVNSVGTRPSLLIQAIVGVGRQRIEDPKIAVRQ